MTTAAIPLGYAVAANPQWTFGTAAARWAAQSMINVGYYGGRLVATGAVPVVTGGAVGFLAAAALTYAYDAYSQIVELERQAARFEPDPTRIAQTIADAGLHEPTSIEAREGDTWVQAITDLNWGTEPEVGIDTVAFDSAVEGVKVGATVGANIRNTTLDFTLESTQENWPDRSVVIPYEELEIGVGSAGEFPQRSAVPATLGQWITNNMVDEPWLWRPYSGAAPSSLGLVLPNDEWLPFSDIEESYVPAGWPISRTGAQAGLSGDKYDVLLPLIPVSVYLPESIWEGIYTSPAEIPAGTWPTDETGQIHPGVAVGAPPLSGTLPRVVVGGEIPPATIGVRGTGAGVELFRKTTATTRAIPAVNTLRQDIKAQGALTYLAALRLVNATWGKASEVLDAFNAFRWNLWITPVGRPIVVYAESIKNRGYYYRVKVTRSTKLGSLPLNAQAEILKKIARGDRDMKIKLDMTKFALDMLTMEVSDRLIAANTKLERSAMNAMQMNTGPLAYGNVSTWWRRSHGWLQ